MVRGLEDIPHRHNTNLGVPLGDQVTQSHKVFGMAKLETEHPGISTLGHFISEIGGCFESSLRTIMESLLDLKLLKMNAPLARAA
jgi:hypothetical protein